MSTTATVSHLAPSEPLAWPAAWKACALLGIVGAALLSLVSAPAWVEGVGLLLAAFPVSIVLLRQPQWAFATWLTVTASLNVLVSQASIDVGFKLYAVDAIFLLASLAALLERGHQGDQAPIFTPRLLLVMCILVAFGLAQTVRGVLAGNAFSDALGTLRRMFFYPVLAFALARVFLRSPRGPHLVQRALWISTVGLILSCVE